MAKKPSLKGTETISEILDAAMRADSEKSHGVLDDIISAAAETLEKVEESANGLAYDREKVKIEGEKVTLNGYFKLARGTFEILRHNIEHGVNTMLIGPTGTGKTEVVANLAKVFDLPIIIFDMGTMTDPVMGLVGTHVITVKDGVTSSEFRRSRFSEVIQHPGIVMLDEISRAAAMANNLLFPCLDFRRELPMEYSFHDTTPVPVHPQCVFFSTANMGSQYTGTHKLDRALLDRFMLIEMDNIGEKEIMETLLSEIPKLKKGQADKIVSVYTKINQEHDDFKISFNLSLRHLKTISKLVSNGFTIYDGFLSICRGLGGKEGLKSIESILNSARE
jgi:midasin (ATPase involved in ribosome maturation)